MKETFSQLRESLAGSSSTCTALAVLRKAAFGAPAVFPVPVVAAEIWNAVERVIHPPKSESAFENLFIRLGMNATKQNRTYVVPNLVTAIHGAGSVDVGCFVFAALNRIQSFDLVCNWHFYIDIPFQATFLAIVRSPESIGRGIRHILGLLKVGL